MTPRICVKRASRTLYGLVDGVSKGGAPVVLTRRGVAVAALVPAGVVNLLAALGAQAIPWPEGLEEPSASGAHGRGQGADRGEGDVAPVDAPIPARGANGCAHEADGGPPGTRGGLAVADRPLSPRDVEGVAAVLANVEGIPREEARARVEAALVRGDRGLVVR